MTVCTVSCGNSKVVNAILFANEETLWILALLKDCTEIAMMVVN
jgi:hypothetical protein